VTLNTDAGCEIQGAGVIDSYGDNYLYGNFGSNTGTSTSVSKQ
jgi:hypothetical protein